MWLDSRKRRRVVALHSFSTVRLTPRVATKSTRSHKKENLLEVSWRLVAPWSESSERSMKSRRGSRCSRQWSWPTNHNTPARLAAILECSGLAELSFRQRGPNRRPLVWLIIRSQSLAAESPLASTALIGRRMWLDSRKRRRVVALQCFSTVRLTPRVSTKSTRSHEKGSSLEVFVTFCVFRGNQS